DNQRLSAGGFRFHQAAKAKPPRRAGDHRRQPPLPQTRPARLQHPRRLLDRRRHAGLAGAGQPIGTRDAAPLPIATLPQSSADGFAEFGRYNVCMDERFTDRARKVMQLTNQEAQRFNHEYIGTEHILLGLVKEGSGVGANVLKNLDVDLRKVRLEVEKLVKSGPDMVTMGKLPQTPRAKKVIEYAIEEARNLNHNYVGTEHLLLGLLREHDGVAAQVLMNLGLKLEEVREEVLNLLGAGVENEEPNAPEKTGQK